MYADGAMECLMTSLVEGHIDVLALSLVVKTTGSIMISEEAREEDNTSYIDRCSSA